MKKNIIIWLTFANLMITTNTSLAASLESPANGATLSGIGFISGWKCHATDITISIDDKEPIPVAMEQERGDLLIHNNCGDGTIHHGFIQQINWALLGQGEHIVKAYDEGVEFGRAVFTVGTIKGEEFLSGVTLEKTVDGFPNPDQQALIGWNESTQHFEVVYVRRKGSTNNYDESYWKEYNNSLRMAEGIWDPELLYAVEPDVNNCQEGRLSQTAKNRALEAVNQIRALHGLVPLRYSSIYNSQVQKASLIQEANNTINFDPDTSFKCYTKEGRDGSYSSLISWQPEENADPATHIIQLVNDSYNADFLSNRRFILDPFLTYFTYGQIKRFGVQKILDFDSEPDRTPQIINVNFIAFPYKTYPFNLLKNNPPWSFSVVSSKRDYWGNHGDFFKNASITVTRVSDGTQLKINKLKNDFYYYYGLPNFVSWNVEDWEYDTLYEVNIKNVTLKNRTTRNYSYSVFVQKQNL